MWGRSTHSSRLRPQRRRGSHSESAVACFAAFVVVVSRACKIVFYCSEQPRGFGVLFTRNKQRGAFFAYEPSAEVISTRPGGCWLVAGMRLVVCVGRTTETGFYCSYMGNYVF